MMEILDLVFAATTGDWDADQHIADDNGPLLIAACLLLLNADIQVAS